MSNGQYGAKLNLRPKRKDFGGEGHGGKYAQGEATEEESFQMDDEEQEEWPAPPKLNAISAEDLARLDQDGMGALHTPAPAEAEKLEWMLKRALDLFFDVLLDENGKPRLTFFYCWDESKSTDLFSTSDGMSNCWEDHAGVGIGRSALEQGEDYLQFLILHELCHVALWDTGHVEDYENFLNYMLQKYNLQYGTDLKNDYEGFEGKVEEQRTDSRAIKPAYRVDAAKFTPGALAALEEMRTAKQTPGHTTQKKATPGCTAKKKPAAKKVRKDGMKTATKKRRSTQATPAAPTARNRMISNLQKAAPANSESGGRKMVKNAAGWVAGAHAE